MPMNQRANGKGQGRVPSARRNARLALTTDRSGRGTTATGRLDKETTEKNQGAAHLSSKPPPPRAVRPGATESSRRRPCHPENTPHALASRPLSYIPLANQTDLSKHQWLRGAESRCVCDRSVCLRRVRIRVAECEQLVCLSKARRRAPATIESDARLVSKAAVQTWGCFVLASAAANGLPTGCPREVPLGCRPT